MVSALHFAGWILCAIYATVPLFWLVIHPFADRWRRHRSPYRRILPLWFCMWIGSIGISAPWRSVVLYSSAWTWLPACVLFTIGIWLYSRAGNGFSARQLGGLPELLPQHPEQRLVVSGIRAHVRHPVYLGHLCEMLAWSLGTGLAACYGLTLFAVVTGWVMIRLEDNELEQRFGEDFRAYRRNVPALWPSFRNYSSGAR